MEEYTIDGFIRMEVRNQMILLIACQTHLPNKIKIHGEALQAMQRVMWMSIALMTLRMIPILSDADTFNWIAMVLIPANI